MHERESEIHRSEAQAEHKHIAMKQSFTAQLASAHAAIAEPSTSCQAPCPACPAKDLELVSLRAQVSTAVQRLQDYQDSYKDLSLQRDDSSFKLNAVTADLNEHKRQVADANAK